ncbi:MAG: CDP-alcohol phosphatidyltransferase family protein [Spirochaetaceae bacterium]|nr:CDP-alcohol phosphatidyltransferase family protein [Spirochaetaceae bacterium]
MVSLTRMALVLPFIMIIHDIFIYECAKNLFLLLLFTFIILSDVADGYLARKLRCASAGGAKLDVVSDAVYTIVSLCAFAYFKVIPVWFVCVMLVKLTEFAITSTLMKKGRKSEAVMFFDKIGKLAVSAVMVLPGIFVFRCVITEYKTVMNSVIYLVTAMLAVSSVRRITNVVKGNA